MIQAKDLEKAEVFLCEGLDGLKNAFVLLSHNYRTLSMLEIHTVGARMVPGQIATPIAGPGPDGGPGGAMATRGHVRFTFLVIAAGTKKP